jgi:hypothetical protein
LEKGLEKLLAIFELAYELRKHGWAARVIEDPDGTIVLECKSLKEWRKRYG